MGNINLGDEVKDSVTGMSGIVVCRMQWLHGCARMIVQPKGVTKEGKPFESSTFDEPQLLVIKKAKAKEGNHVTGGPVEKFVAQKHTPGRY